MKIFAAFVLAFLSCMCAAGQCLEVRSAELPETKPSTRNAKIMVRLSGKPRGNARLAVSLPERRSVRSFVSDSDGIVILKDLPEGMSCITATAEDNLRDVLCLVVPARAKDEVSSFYMALSPALGFDARVRRAEQSGQRLRLRRLVGTVLDENDAMIPGTDIRAYKQGKYPEGLVATIETNEVGHFAASLEPGTYTVVIHKPWFESEVVIVEISPDGSEKEVRKTLKVAATDTCGNA